MVPRLCSGRLRAHGSAGVLGEYDGGDNLLRKFIYGPGIDEPICMIDVADSNAVYYYHFDGLGSVAALSDVNNVIVERYSYDVFGAPTIYDANYAEISQSAIGNPYMFTARRADDETALYYYRARYYAFDIGRFLQTDPIGYSDGLNVYAYVGNNPVNLIDPMGLCKEDRSFLTKLWEGDYVGTQYGSAALDKYAYEIAFGNASWYNYSGAFFSSLWQPESWRTTTITLGTAAYSAVQARIANNAAQVSAQQVSNLSTKEKTAIQKIINNIDDHLQPDDIVGGIKDMVGNPVPKPTGGYYNHAQEVNDALRGLRNSVQTLNGVNNVSATTATEQAIQIINEIEAAIQGLGI